MPTLKNSWKYLLLLLLLCFPLFLFLGALSIRLWDESRLAINAYEMYHSGNYLIPTFNGEPDMWNTKPPLMIWCQVIGMKLLGINEWAIRLPSALAALFTCAIIMLIAVRYVKNFWFGFICTLVLVTTSGYVEIHTTRTGDYDALLTLFLTLSSFSFFLFLENSKTKYLYLFFISMIFAVLTKSVAAFMIVPGLFIYSIAQKKLFLLLKNKHLYIGLLFFIMGASGYYFLREIYNPGYIKAVMGNEFGGRFLNTLEEHHRNFWYYFEHLFSNRFLIWVLFLPCGIFVGLRNKNLRIKKLTLFSSIMAFAYLLVISSAQTKLAWYVVPVYPFFAFIVGIFIYHIFLRIKEKKTLKHKALPFIFLGLIFIAPYGFIVGKLYQQKRQTWNKDDYGVCYYLRDILHDKIRQDNFTVLYDGYFAHGYFYLLPLQKQGKNISLKNAHDDVENGEVVLISQSEVKDFLEEHYDLKTLEESQIIGLYEVVGKKSK